MKINPVLEEHYGELVYTNNTTDTIRREECMCMHCANMTYDKNTNCPIAQSFYEICCNKNVAFMMTRCKNWKQKN